MKLGLSRSRSREIHEGPPSLESEQIEFLFPKAPPCYGIVCKNNSYFFYYSRLIKFQVSGTRDFSIKNFDEKFILNPISAYGSDDT